MRSKTHKRGRKAISWVVCITMVLASFAGPFSYNVANADTEQPITVSKAVVGSDWVDKDQGIAKVKLTVNSQDIETTVTTPKTTRIVLVLDYSASMDGSKISTLKTKAKAFVSQMLGMSGDIQVGLVIFNNSSTTQGFTNNVTTLNNKIDNTGTAIGTNIQAGIHQGQLMLDGVTADNEIMVVLTDGEPNRSYQATAAQAVTAADTALNYNGTEWPSVITGFNYGSTLGTSTYNYTFNSQTISGRTINNHGYGTVSEALLAKKAGTTIYSVAFDVGATSTAAKVVESVASSDDKYFLATSDLTVAFNTIGTSIIEQAAGSGATVVDPMGYNTNSAAGLNYKFSTLIDASHPVVITNPDGSTTATTNTGSYAGTNVTSSYAYDATTDAFNWVLTSGNIKEGTYTLTYYVKIKDINGTGVGDNVTDVLTNHQAVLTYTDSTGAAKSLSFTDPTLKVEHYTVEYYFNGVKDDTKTTTQAAIAGRTPVTVTAPSFAGYDYDKTIYGNDTNSTALNIVQDGANNVIKLYYCDKKGTLTVTKDVLKNSEAFNVTDTFHIGLFTGANGTGLVGSAKSVSLNDASTGSVEFTGLTQGTTYYVFETNASGTPITDETGGYITMGNYVIDGQGSSFTPSKANLNGEATVTNNVAVGTSAEFEGTKNLTGRYLTSGDTFHFVVFEGTSTTPIASGQTEAVSGSTSDSVGIAFDEIQYGIEDVGLHTYTVKEIPPISGVVNGILYDTTPRTVTVDVTMDATGVLTATVNYPGEATELEFTNEYTTFGSGEVAVTKELTGDKDLAADMFDFTITQTDSAWTAMADGYTETVSNDADGTIDFSAIEYTAPGTYYYIITEVTPTGGVADGITYDTNTIKVTMTVTDDGLGTLTATPSYAGGQKFTNEYNTKGSGEVDVTKELTGDKDLAANMFDFTITQTDSAWAAMADGYTQTVKNDADGTIDFSAINYTKAGTYYYTITENSGTLGGITYDTDTIKVTMTVTDDGAGNLTATPSYAGGQKFTNEYNTKGSGEVDVTKELTGMDLTDDQFSFTITQTGTDEATPYTQTVKNDADGTIPFSAINYTKAGTYTYEITENVPADATPGITYDTDAIKVTMTVTDDGKGNLTATPSYEGGQVFTNSYEGPGSITVTKKVVVLTDDESILVNYSFYAALFEEQDGQLVRVSDVKELDIVDSADATATFDNLDLDKTYYAYETDADGNIIETQADGTIVTPIIPDWTHILYENNVVALNSDVMTGSSTITNVFDPEDMYLYGSITVKKTVTVNDKATASNKTFYVGLFSDKEMTKLVSEVKALKMNGNSSTTVEFITDKDGNPLLAGETYYIAETDKNGVAITDSLAQLGCEMTIDDSSVVITEEGTTVNLINNFSKEEFPLTGDSSNMNLWLFLAMLGVAGAIAPFAFRKKERNND